MKEQFILSGAEGLAIGSQTVYAGRRGEKPMSVDAIDVEAAQRTAQELQKAAKLKELAKGGNGEAKQEQKASGDEQKTLQQLAKEGQKRETPRRVENFREKLKPHLAEFHKKVGEQVGTMQINDIKREIVALHQVASKIERKLPKGEREELWKEVYAAVKDAYAELSRRGVDTTNFAHREVLVHEADNQFYPPPVFEEEQVRANASIEDPQKRVEAAEVLLKVELREASEPDKLSRQGKAIIAAHNVTGEGVYKYTIGQLRQKMQILRDAEFSERQIRTLLEAGIAGVLPPDTFVPFDPATTGDPILGPIAQQVERTFAANAADEDFLNRTEARIERLVDEGRVPAAQAEEILNSLEGWRVQAQRGMRDEREEGPRIKSDRELQEEEDRRFLSENEAGAFNPNEYEHPRVAQIAREIKDTIVAEHANNRYFKRKIDDLVGLRDRTAPTEHLLQSEAAKLQREVQTLKDALAAKLVTLELMTGRSLYGEIRMKPEEQRALLNIALEDTPEAMRELERKFNRLFARADINANDEWRDALGQAGSFELDDFMTTLANAATGRTLTLGRALSPGEVKILERKIRQLEMEKKLRETLHSISYYVNRNFTVEDIAKVAAHFVAEEADVAYSKKGVVTVSHFFEQAMYQVIARHGGFLPPEAMINKIDGTPGEVEVLVRQQIRAAKETGLLPRDMEDWEENRAISLARGMGIMSARFFEIIARAGVPQDNPLVGWWANDVIKKISYFKQVARYNIGHEANRFLCYKLEGGAPVWSLRELSEITDEELNNQIIFGMTDKEGDDRYISMVNPARIGSIFTQTRWRYIDEPLHGGGAVAALLKGYRTNPLLGVGMWIEKERMNMRSTKAVKAEMRDEIRRVFGKDVKTEAEEAEIMIRKNLELATKITPLKLFYELPWFEKRIIEKYYIPAGRRSEYDALIKAKKYSEAFTFRRMRVQEMDADLTALAIVQEKLLAQRAEPFRDYVRRLREWEADDPATRGEQPAPLTHEQLNLYEDRTLTTLPFDILGATPEAQAQIRRLSDFSKHVREEFLESNNIDHLIHDLKDKGWKVPYIFGTDDLPLDLYDWKATGATSYKRRWESDIGSVSGAMDAYEQMLKGLPGFQDQDTIIKTLEKVHLTLSGHDESVSQEMMYRTIEGITKFYKKGWLNRGPFLSGTILNTLGGAASYAQLKFGREAMAWDETKSYEFIHKARAANLITDEHLHKLEKQTGSRGAQVAIDIGRTLQGIILAGFILYLATKVIEEK